MAGETLFECGYNGHRSCERGSETCPKFKGKFEKGKNINQKDYYY